MKSFKKLLLTVSLLFVTALILVSCKKDYLTDGGTSNANTSYSTYDYLANQEYHYFDTVILIIDHFGLKDSVNKAVTFFAPTDYSINRLMSSLGVSSLNSLYEHITSKLLTQYMFSNSITLANTTTSAVAYENWADTIAGIKKTAYSYSAASSTFTYYILQYVRINGYLDGTSGAPLDDPTDLTLNCQTTGIKTSSGTTLHVLSNASSLATR